MCGPGGEDGKRQDLASNPEMEQKEFQQMTATFPNRGWTSTTATRRRPTCMRAKTCCWTTTASIPGESGTIRIPISRAMELIAQRGLPVNAQCCDFAVELAGDEKPVVQAPLTTGFARTGYELEAIEARGQKLSYGKASASKAELAPAEVVRIEMEADGLRVEMISGRTIRARRKTAAMCCAVLCCLAMSACGSAQVSSYGDKQGGENAGDQLPHVLAEGVV